MVLFSLYPFIEAGHIEVGVYKLFVYIYVVPFLMNGCLEAIIETDPFKFFVINFPVATVRIPFGSLHIHFSYIAIK